MSAAPTARIPPTPRRATPPPTRWWPTIVGLFFLALVVIAAVGLIWLVRHPRPPAELVLGESRIYIPRLPGMRPRAMHRIVLERRGVTLTGGVDDSTRNQSSVVRNANRTSVVVPAFRGSDTTWRNFVRCVRERYAPFDVEVLDERPDARGYILVAVGGTPSLVGAARNVGGLAPFNSDPIEDAVVFVFAAALQNSVRTMCDVAAMETAHAYGLDHVYNCRDPMTYLPSCGTRSFQNTDSPCGEHRRRACANGSPTQNSYARLLEVLGPRR